mmetsp:Transcript_45441/g.135581  ORF Transcript_45441/g.135581 Transcript_45441/m.135581 type:complete len:270 (-) Transcript_45441:519-1328(-)
MTSSRAHGSIATAVGTWWQKCVSTSRIGAYCHTRTVRSSADAVATKLRLTAGHTAVTAPVCVGGSTCCHRSAWSSPPSELIASCSDTTHVPPPRTRATARIPHADSDRCETAASPAAASATDSGTESTHSMSSDALSLLQRYTAMWPLTIPTSSLLSGSEIMHVMARPSRCVSVTSVASAICRVRSDNAMTRRPSDSHVWSTKVAPCSRCSPVSSRDLNPDDAFLRSSTCSGLCTITLVWNLGCELSLVTTPGTWPVLVGCSRPPSSQV